MPARGRARRVLAGGSRWQQGGSTLVSRSFRLVSFPIPLSPSSCHFHFVPIVSIETNGRSEGVVSTNKTMKGRSQTSQLTPLTPSYQHLCTSILRINGKQPVPISRR